MMFHEPEMVDIIWVEVYVHQLGGYCSYMQSLRGACSGCCFLVAIRFFFRGIPQQWYMLHQTKTGCLLQHHCIFESALSANQKPT